MDEKRFILVTYDVKDDRRRNKIANELKNFGVRVQYSVFECLLNDKDNQTMRNKIVKYVRENEDSVRYYQLCAICKDRIDIQGSGMISEDRDYWVV